MAPAEALPQEIDAHLYDLSLVKTELDEVLQEHFSNSKKYEVNTKAIDIRIGIGIITCLLTGIAYLLFKRDDFLSYKKEIVSILVLFWVLVYSESIIMKLFFYHTFIGRDQNKGKVHIITKIAPTAPVYTVLIYTERKKIPIKITIDIRRIYTGNRLLSKKYTKILDESIDDRTEHNRTAQNRTGQDRTEQNRK